MTQRVSQFVSHVNRARLQCLSQKGARVFVFLCFAGTYDVCTERSEGVGPTHVQMGGVEPLEETNVIKTLRLQNLEKPLLCSSENTQESDAK